MHACGIGCMGSNQGGQNKQLHEKQLFCFVARNLHIARFALQLSVVADNALVRVDVESFSSKCSIY
jgi:hypothetical protein